tara:strand:- start:962 stop:1102 length:141 start_codon:yes stop_codon:yes gene_type:complete
MSNEETDSKPLAIEEKAFQYRGLANYKKIEKWRNFSAMIIILVPEK